MRETLITVVVPAYNVEEYLPRCVESIITQTYQNLEIILVNDGSTDKSGEICEAYAKKDDRIKVIHKENSGPSESRNIGLETAKGEYITFIDADDFIHESYIERLYSLAEMNGSEIVCCNYTRGDADDFSGVKAEKQIEERTYTADEMLRNWHGKYKHLETVIWNKLYKKELFEKNHIRYPEDCISGEDVQITHLLVANARQVTITNETLYYYFRNKQSITSSASKEKVVVNEVAQKKRLEFFQQNGYLEAYERMLIKLQKYYMLMYCRLHEDKSYRKELKEKFAQRYNEVKSLKTTSATENILFISFKYFYRLYEIVFYFIRL